MFSWELDSTARDDIDTPVRTVSCKLEMRKRATTPHTVSAVSAELRRDECLIVFENQFDKCGAIVVYLLIVK